MRLNLYDLSKLSRSRIIHPEKIERVIFTGVSIDSRSCKKNDLFIAIKGEKFDGHNFLNDVFSKGIKAAVVQKSSFNKLKKIKSRIVDKRTHILVDDTLRSLGELARNYRNRFVIPVIAVGGSNGKTGTKDLIAYVLSKKYKVLKTEKNYNNAIGVPLTLFKLDKDHELCVIETGTNHFGEVKELCRITNPQFGVITNIGREHLEFFKTIQGVIKAEFELAEFLDENYGTFFLNMNDSFLRKYIPIRRLKTFSFGSGLNVEVKGKLKKINGFYPEIEIKFKGKAINTKLNTIGYQSFETALCAASIGFYFDVPIREIEIALKEFTPCSGGRNALTRKDGVYIIDDTYNSNPDSVKAALENLYTYKTNGRKHVVLGDMLELGNSSRKEHKITGQLVNKMGFNNLYTYGNESYETFKGAKGVKNNYYFSDKVTLAEFLKLNLKKDDIVLVKGSRGMRMEEIINSI